jgi:transcriptional regulator GlxA family with amidase domain
MIGRRRFLHLSTAAGIGVAVSAKLVGQISKHPDATEAQVSTGHGPVNALTFPASGSIPVAFVLSDGAVMIDFAGPWEVLQDTRIPGKGGSAFELFTVAESLTPIRASAGMRILPDYTFENAPNPKVIIIPAQSGNQKMIEWIRQKSKSADVTASVCTGAFVLAQTGLLAGKAVATHHNAYQRLAMQYSDIHVMRGARFVDDGNVSSSGGLSSGIDLALHIVERYFDREAATQTAYQMEYQGVGWTDPSSNRQYLQKVTSTDAKPRCAVCGMDVDAGRAPNSKYNGKTYYFCGPAHKQTFDASPAAYV